MKFFFDGLSHRIWGICDSLFQWIIQVIEGYIAGSLKSVFGVDQWSSTHTIALLVCVGLILLLLLSFLQDFQPLIIVVLIIWLVNFQIIPVLKDHNTVIKEASQSISYAIGGSKKANTYEPEKDEDEEEEETETQTQTGNETVVENTSDSENNENNNEEEEADKNKEKIWEQLSSTWKAYDNTPYTNVVQKMEFWTSYRSNLQKLTNEAKTSRTCEQVLEMWNQNPHLHGLSYDKAIKAMGNGN